MRGGPRIMKPEDMADKQSVGSWTPDLACISQVATALTVNMWKILEIHTISYGGFLNRPHGTLSGISIRTRSREALVSLHCSTVPLL